MNNKFGGICCLSQSDVKKFVTKQLWTTHDKVIEDDGFVYAQGTFPVLLVAHLDTVHKELPQKILYDSNLDSCFSPQGIGGDDRCGIYMILEVIKKFNCSVLFCEDEEIGCVGAHKFIKHEVVKDLKFNYIIEFDRKGKNDAVFYDCDNPEFTDFILSTGFYKEDFGSFSDISVLAPALGCAAVNLSCGYYKAHTTDEYVILSQMEDSIKAACAILALTTEKNAYEYIEYVWANKKPYGGYDDWYNDVYGSANYYYIIDFLDDQCIEDWEDYTATSAEEAIGQWCIAHPGLTYNHIIAVERI